MLVQAESVRCVCVLHAPQSKGHDWRWHPILAEDSSDIKNYRILMVDDTDDGVKLERMLKSLVPVPAIMECCVLGEHVRFEAWFMSVCAAELRRYVGFGWPGCDRATAKRRLPGVWRERNRLVHVDR